MTKRIFATCGAVLLSAVGLYSACDDATFKDCKLKCDEVHNTCIQQCNDEVCKTKCTTDLDDCKVSCDEITTSKPDGG